MRLVFEWDSNKAAANVRKHGVTFEEAKSIFSDEALLTIPDDFHSDDERRFLSVGLSEKARVLLVVNTESDGMADEIVIRIVSARKATPKERKRYEEEK